MCQACNQKQFKFRCQNCFHRPVTCAGCCAKSHADLPFHSVDVWNGTCFLPSDLMHAGIAIYLGHQGFQCPEYERADVGKSQERFKDVESEEDFDELGARLLQIIHSNGVCERNIWYCKCSNAPPHHLQLLQHRLFPASCKKPQTAFTFEVLCHFHIDAMECKTSANNFYSKLRRLTSNGFPDTVPVGFLFPSFSCHTDITSE